MLKIIDVKEALAEALFDVVQHKDVSKVTVQDIAEAANTSRRTFYNHFEDKYALINWVYQKEIEEILKAFDEDNYYDCMVKTYYIFWNKRVFSQEL